MKILNSSRSNQDNLNAVLKQLRISGKQSNADLSRIFDVPAGTTARHLARLEDLNLIRKVLLSAKGDKQVGKPPIFYEINPDAATIMAVEVNKYKIRIAAADFSGRILFENEHQTASKEKVIIQTKSLIDHQLKYWPNRISAPGCISLGVSGTISKDNILRGNIFPLNTNLQEFISQDLEIPVLVENDANLAVIAEKTFGSGWDASDIVCILDSYDFGLGLFINGSLYKGAHGRAGETTIDEIYNQKNPPWKLAGGLKLEDALKEKSLTQADCHDHGMLYQFLGQQAEGGDNAAQEVLNHLAAELAEETLRLLRLFDPEKIIIAGNVIEAGQFFEDVFLKKLEMLLGICSEGFQLSQIMFSHLKQGVVIMGAIAVGIEWITQTITEK